MKRTQMIGRLKLPLICSLGLLGATTAQACPACVAQGMLIALPVVFGIKLLIAMALVFVWLDAIRFLMVFIPAIFSSYLIGIIIIMPLFFMVWFDGGHMADDRLVVLAPIGIINAIDCVAIFLISRRAYFKRRSRHEVSLPLWVLPTYWSLLTFPILCIP